MKKSLMILLAVLALNASVKAEAIEDVTGNRQDRLIEEMKDNWHRLFAGATLPGATTYTLDVKIDGKYAVVGGDATTGLMVQAVSVTGTTNTAPTITFAVAFGAAPVIVCTYTQDQGDVRSVFVTAETASNFVANVTASKDFNYIAIGTRP